MERITEKDLKSLVSTINDLTGSPVEPYTQDPETKQVRANIGNYHISSAYGGVNLERMSNTGGGVQTVFCCGHTTKRDLYNRMQSFIYGLQSGK